jgi:hypothetical protein
MVDVEVATNLHAGDRHVDAVKKRNRAQHQQPQNE